MKLIDANGVQFVIERRMILQENYFIAPEIEEEVEIMEIALRAKVPPRILSIKRRLDYFNEPLYLKHFKDALNTQSGWSMYNWSGFGDISLIATVATILEVIEKNNQLRLFPTSEIIEVYTNDAGLRKRLEKKFTGTGLVILPIDRIT